MKHKFNSPFYFVRHGQTDWNKLSIVMGSTDIPLNAEGIAQAHELAKNIVGIEVACIVSSPLLRAKQTAEIVAAALGTSFVIVDELQELCAGVLEKRTRDADLLEHWRRGGEIEGAEKTHEFIARVATALEKSLQLSTNEKPVLIVAHGMVSWAVQHILGLEFEAASNCQIVYHELCDDGWKRSPRKF